MYAVHLEIATVLATTGQSFSQFQRICELLSVPMLRQNHYIRLVGAYVAPCVKVLFNREIDRVLSRLDKNGEDLHFAADGRYQVR